MNKSQIRKNILNLRKNSFNKNLKINLDKFFSFLKTNTKSKNIGGYYPSNFEIDNLEVLYSLKKKNYKISLPKIEKNNKMNFFRWSSEDFLKINKFGIPEPTSLKIVFPDILLIPLVAFDKNLNRLGYGGGFYDRYIDRIEKTKKVTKIGLAFSYQKVRIIPINQYDKKLDYVITEKEILK